MLLCYSVVRRRCRRAVLLASVVAGPVAAEDIVRPSRERLIAETRRICHSSLVLRKCEEFPSVDDDLETLKNATIAEIPTSIRLLDC